MNENHDKMVLDLGFEPQKTVFYNKFLPYCNDINKEASLTLQEIKKNLCDAVINRDIRYGATYWVCHLVKYINLYGLCFSKEDHIFFVKLFYELAVDVKQEVWLSTKFFKVFSDILKKKEILSPDDLVLEWKPLYEYYEKYFKSSDSPFPSNMRNFFFRGSESTFRNAVIYARTFFPPSATQEILDEFRPFLCSTDMALSEGLMLLEVFLPNVFISDQAAATGYELWLDEFINLFDNSNLDKHVGSTVFSIISKLCWANIGCLGNRWGNCLEYFFNGFIRTFYLPICYKNESQYGGLSSVKISSMCTFIISNLQEKEIKAHLKQLLNVLYSYCHPSNFGSWTMKIVDFSLKLCEFFIKRLQKEKYPKDSWIPNVPEDKKLTEEDIDDFVDMIFPAASRMTFSKMGGSNAGLIFQKLAMIRPQKILPYVITQLESSFETLTEPHRLLSSLMCADKLVRPLITGGQVLTKGNKEYPEAQAYVIPLLMACLPAVDLNDIHKCTAAIHFIASVTYAMPLVDCSAALDDEECQFTQIERTVCEQSAQLEEFVLQLLERYLSLIEACSIEDNSHHDREGIKNIEENVLDVMMSNSFQSILTQADDKIFDITLDRLWRFTKGRSMETKVSGKLLGSLCRAAVKANTEKTLNVFMDPTCKLLLTLTEPEEVQQCENLDNEIQFNLLLLSELVRGSNFYLVKYVPTIIKVLEQVLYLKCVKSHKSSANILHFLLQSLSTTVYVDFKSHPYNFDNKDKFPIKLWGKYVPEKELNVKWHEPGEEQKTAIEKILNKFLVHELQLIKRIMNDEETVIKERFHQSLHIINDSLSAGCLLPFWDEELVPLMDMSVPEKETKVRYSSKVVQVSLNCNEFPSNVRQAIANTALDLTDHLLKKDSDDTTAFGILSTIMFNVSLYFGVRKDVIEQRQKLLNSLKRNQLVIEKKRNVRPFIIERVMIQHQLRLLEYKSPFTKTQLRILNSLWDIATSHYSESRKRGQHYLNYFFDHYPYSYKLILPRAIEVFKTDPEKNHEAFKGALYVTISQGRKSLILRRDWKTANLIWPALVASKHSEKNSVISLFDGFVDTADRHYEQFGIEVSNNEEAATVAKTYMSEHKMAMDSTTEQKWLKKAEDKYNSNINEYISLVSNIAKILMSKTVHYRKAKLGLTMLKMLVRKDTEYPAPGVKAVFSYVLNDLLLLRKSALHISTLVLKNQRRKREIIEVDLCNVNGQNSPPERVTPGDARADNEWLQYDPESINMSEEKWNNGVFINRSYIGWYCWPKKLNVFAPCLDQPKINRDFSELSEVELIIYNFMNDEQNIKKLFEFFSLDNGHKDFQYKISVFFKFICRNFGSEFLPKIIPHVKRLAAEQLECSQRCAAEVLSGIVRGSKLWPYKESMELLNESKEIIRMSFSTAMNETLADWGLCMMLISRDIDPNKIFPLIEVILEQPIVNNDQGAFIASNALYIRQKFIEQLEWRASYCLHKLLDALKPELSNSYKSVRDRIGDFLLRIFSPSMPNRQGFKSINPSQSEFLEYVLPNLHILTQGPGSPSVTRYDYQSSDILPSESTLQPKLSDLSLSNTGIIVNELDQGLKNDQEEPNLLDIVSKQDSSQYDIIRKHELTPMSFCDTTMTTGASSDDTEERQVAYRLFNTISKYLKHSAVQGHADISAFKFLPHLCNLESFNSEQEVMLNCHGTLVVLSKIVMMNGEDVDIVFNIIQDILSNGWWKARCSAMEFMQVFVFYNVFSIYHVQKYTSVILKMVLQTITDSRVEVRQTASKLLSSFFHFGILQSTSEILDIFKNKIISTRRKNKRIALTSDQLLTRHAGILGYGAFVNAFPYTIHPLMPSVLVTLADCMNDPNPISTDIKQALSSFKRTHYDNWQEHKKNFTLEQLDILTDVLVSPSYYA